MVQAGYYREQGGAATDTMSSNDFSDVKMMENMNWREQNWRSPGPPEAPRYFLPRQNNFTNKFVRINFESPTFWNKVMPLPKWGFAQSGGGVDQKKFETGRVDFYPEFEGISKILRDTFVNVHNNNNLGMNKNHTSPHGSAKPVTDIFGFKTEHRLNSNRHEKESNVDNCKADNKKKEHITLSTCPSEKVVMKDPSMLQQIKHGTDMKQPLDNTKILDEDVRPSQRPKKHKQPKDKNKKSKKVGGKANKSKSKKHKTKSETICDILDDYYQKDFIDSFEEDRMENVPARKSASKTILNHKISPSVMDENMTNSTCSSKLSLSIEKCWNYLQSLPPVKCINDVMKTSNEMVNSVKSSSPNQPNTFVYVHNLDAGHHLATETLPCDINNCSNESPNINNTSGSSSRRSRLPSECDTEDSFVIFFEESPVDNNRLNGQVHNETVRKPSVCESNDSFVICFGESSQSPQECFMFEDLVDRLSSDCDSIESSSEYESSSNGESDDCSSSHVCDSEFSSTTAQSDSVVIPCKNYDEIRENLSTKDFSSSRMTDDKIDKVDGYHIGSNTKHQSPRQQKKKTKKTVTFSPLPPKVREMRAWAFAYRAARSGGIWERAARDRVRFARRIQETGRELDGILGAGHRTRVYRERFEKREVTEELDPEPDTEKLPGLQRQLQLQS